MGEPAVVDPLTDAKGLFEKHVAGSVEFLGGEFCDHRHLYEVCFRADGKDIFMLLPVYSPLPNDGGGMMWRERYVATMLPQMGYHAKRWYSAKATGLASS